MNDVTFEADSQTAWSDEVVEITHAISWEPDRPRLLSTVGVRNSSGSQVWVPEPLVMPFGDERKNCIRITDSSKRELRQRGVHTEFRTNDAGQQVLPYVHLQPGETREWIFDLVDGFEDLSETEGEVTVELTYGSPADTASHFDDQGNLHQIPCWQGTSDLPAIRLRVATAP